MVGVELEEYCDRPEGEVVVERVDRFKRQIDFKLSEDHFKKEKRPSVKGRPRPGKKKRWGN